MLVPGCLIIYSWLGFNYLGTAFHDRHALGSEALAFSPSGLYGHGLGMLAALLMLLLWFYIIRKRWRRLQGVGRLSQWLKYHMWFGITAPLLAAYHAGFKFEGLIGVMYWAMLAVMLSGIIGRYLYGHIPRRRDGHEMSLRQINTERAAKLRALQMEFGVDADDINQIQSMTPPSSNQSILNSMVSLVKFDLSRRSQLRTLLKTFNKKYGISKNDLGFIKATLNNQLVLNQRLVVLDAVNKIFHWWHLIHKPFAYAIFVVLILHVIITLSLGFTWIF